MPPSASQLALIRMQIADTGTPPTFTDEEIGDLWDIALETYTSGGQLNAQTRIYLLDALLADSAKRVTYEQNQSKEQLSDIFKHLEKLRAIAVKDLADASAVITAGLGAVRLGSLHKVKPTRKRDVPRS